MENREAYKRAEKRVEARLGFYFHLAIFVAVNGLLIVINLRGSGQGLWFKWPLIGWGIGLIFHGLKAFNVLGKSAIKDQMIEREMRRDGMHKP